jgi:hypothetical protein
MAIHRRVTFNNARIVLDNETYEGCTFDGCTVVYSAKGPYQMSNCAFNNSPFTFDGSAAMTLKFLSDIYKMNPAMVEGIFAQIKQGVG